jgi:hypothetical protein
MSESCVAANSKTPTHSLSQLEREPSDSRGTRGCGTFVDGIAGEIWQPIHVDVIVSIPVD